MKKILILYWSCRTLIPELKHNAEFEYSPEKVNEAVQTVLANDLNVMLINNSGENKDNLYIYIDERKFRQY
jgi:hypothetical protein